MPTYQYACTECGTPLEVVQSFSDPALTECPSCGGRLRKVFSAVGVVFKGSGFYRTDSRSDAKSKVNGNGSKADSPAATPADASKAGDGAAKSAAPKKDAAPAAAAGTAKKASAAPTSS